jgi:DNA-binding NarL/FixJ family response regulator
MDSALMTGTVISLESARRRSDRGRATTTVVIAGVRTLVRAGVRMLLERDRHITVLGETDPGEDETRFVLRTRPDVVLVEVPETSDDLARVNQLAASGAGVMLIDEPDTDHALFEALRAGVRGVLAKDAQPSELAHAIRVLASGQPVLSHAATRRLIGALDPSTSTR